MRYNHFKYSSLKLPFIATLVLYTLMHICSWSYYPPDVDPINFTMALQQYDISTDSPHPPGYPLYVGLGRVASHIISSHHAYQLINLFMLISAALCLYITTQSRGYPQVGFASALILLTHPISLAATLVSETYFSDAFFGCLIATWLITNSNNFRKQLIGVFLIFLALGLFRAISCIELTPLALACVYLNANSERTKKLCITAIYILASTAIAYLTTVWLAGGLQIYSTAITRVMGNAVSQLSFFAGAPIKSHLFMLVRLFVWLLFISLPTLIVVGYIKKKHQIKMILNGESKKLLIVSACWTLPILGLYTFVYFLKPTYLLAVMPPIFLIFTACLFFIFKSQYQFYAWACVVLVVSFQLAFFYSGTKLWPEPIYRITNAYLKQQDKAWAELMKVALAQNSEKTLFVWIKHPTLTVYAARLIPWNGGLSILDFNLTQKNSSLVRLDPITMQWGGPEDNFIVTNKFNRILVLDTQEDRATYNIYDVNKFIEKFNILNAH